MKFLEQVPNLLSLTDEDRYILTVLDANRGKALTLARIINESVRLNRVDPQHIKRLADSAIRKRVPILLERGFVVRPPRTTKKGISITDVGQAALNFAAGNPTET